MRVNLTFVFVALGLAAPAAGAVVLKAGFGHVDGAYDYGQVDLNAKGLPVTNKSELISAGVITMAVASLNPVTDMIAAGFEIGVSMSGKFDFDTTKQVNPATGDPNPNEGDTESYSFTRIPLLLRGDVSYPVGPGRVRVGLGVGAVIIAWSQVSVETFWSDAFGGMSIDRDLTYTRNARTDTSYASGLGTLFDVEVTPGYNYPLGEKDFIGLEIPIAIVSKAVFDGGEEKSNPAPTNGSSNPYIYKPKITLGGFGWGVAVSWTHQL